MAATCTCPTGSVLWRRSADFSSCSRTSTDDILSLNILLEKSSSQVSETGTKCELIFMKCCDNTVMLSGSTRVVRGEGMPQYRNPFEKGDLYIKFEVQFPDNGWISTEKLTVRFSWDCPS